MEKQLKCVQLFTLEEMALRRLTVVLLSGSDVLASISNSPLPEQYKSKGQWRKIIHKIKNKMTYLKMPESLTKRMIDIVPPICLEIKRWEQFHKGSFSPSKRIRLLGSVKLCWSMEGNIYYRKTAGNLLRCNALDVVHRYEIACLHCLEDCIPLLWEKLPEDWKNIFCNQNHPEEDLPFFWPHILTGELSNLDDLWKTSDRNLTSFNQYAFEYAAESGYKTAAEYFFRNLTHEVRQASLMRSAHAVLANPNKQNEKLTDVYFYLLSLMSSEQQMEILKAQPVGALLSFLHWPRQDLFLENAIFFLTILPPSSYGDLLEKMADIFKYSGHYFPKLFREFLMEGPFDFRESFVEYDFNRALSFLYVFVQCEDSDSIGVIFRILDATDRVKLLFHRYVLEILCCCVLDRGHVVEVCLREAGLSDEDKERLKGTFKGALQSNGSGQTEWKRFLQLLDKATGSADKEKRAEKRKLKNTE